MKLNVLFFGLALTVLPALLAPPVEAATDSDRCYYHHGHHYRYRHHGNYYRYRWNGGYYNYRYNGGYYRYRWNGGYYNYRNGGHYYRHRYGCGGGWCYR
jgi:hypothetical protein